MIYIVIPVFNRWKFTKDCLLSLRNQTYSDFKTIVIDHGSTDGTSEYIQNEFPEVIVIKGYETMWWTAATNVGVRYTLEKKADFVLTLNNDLVVDSNYLQTLIDLANQNPKTLIGSASVNKNNPLQIVYAGTKWNKWTAKYKSSIRVIDFHQLKEKFTSFDTDLLPGRGTLIPIEAFQKVGLFDEVNFPHYAADEEFSNRCKNNGYKLIVSSNSIVFSEIEATGLKNVHQSKGINYWKDLFTSMRSPVNLKRRWLWAKLNSPVPIFYFLIDFFRIVGSQIKNNFR